MNLGFEGSTELSHKIATNDIESARSLALSARDAGQVEEALAIFQSIIQRWDTDERSYVDIGICLITLGRTTEARGFLVDSLNGRIGDGPWRREAMRTLALAARDTGQIEQALAIFQSIIQRWDTDERSYVDIGICLIALGRGAEARDFLLDSLDGRIGDGPWRLHGLHQLAQAHRIQGDLALALDALSKAEDIKPGDPGIVIEMLQTAVQMPERELIQPHLTRAEQILGLDAATQHSTHLRRLKADLAWRFGEIEDSNALLRRDLDISWSSYTARKLVQQLSRQGRTSDALQALEDLLRRSSHSLTDIDILSTYVEVQLRCGRIHNAVAVVELASQAGVDSPGMRHLLFSLYITTMQFEKAEKQVCGYEDVYDRLMRAKLYWVTGRFRDAEALATEIECDDRVPIAFKNYALQLILNVQLIAVELERAETTLARRINLNKKDTLNHHYNPLYQDRILAYRNCESDIKNYLHDGGLREMINIRIKHEKKLSHISDCCSSLAFMKIIYSKFLQKTSSQHDYKSLRCATRTIPKKIMQYWDQDEIPGDIVPLMAQWKNGSVGHSYEIFNYRSALDFIRQHSDPAILERFQRSSHPAMRSDIFRMVWLHREGGFYIDADECRATEPLAFSLDTDVILPLVNHDDCHVQNGFIGAIPGSWLTSRFLETIAAMEPEAFESGLVWWLTGPGHVTRIVASHLAQRIARDAAYDARGSDILIARDLILFPKTLLDVEMFTPELKYKRTSLSWQQARANEQNSAVHRSDPLR